MEKSYFWAFFIVTIVAGVSLGAMVGGITGQATWWESLTQVRSQQATTTQTQSAVSPSQVTYQGVLNMLSKCTVSNIDPGYRCDLYCSGNNKGTCTAAFSFDSDTGLKIPIECIKNAGVADSIYCVCCSP